MCVVVPDRPLSPNAGMRQNRRGWVYLLAFCLEAKVKSGTLEPPHTHISLPGCLVFLRYEYDAEDAAGVLQSSLTQVTFGVEEGPCQRNIVFQGVSPSGSTFVLGAYTETNRKEANQLEGSLISSRSTSLVWSVVLGRCLLGPKWP